MLARRLLFIAATLLTTLVHAHAVQFPNRECADLLVGGAPRQNVSNLPALYVQADLVLPVLRDFVTELAAETGATAEVMPLKDPSRAAEKTGKDGDASNVLDLARAALICNSLDQAYAVLSATKMRAREIGATVLLAKDRFQEPKPSGYRDIHVNIRMPPTGHIVELQIHLRELYALKKERGDALYREIRVLEKNTDAESRRRVDELIKEHRRIFDKVFERNYGPLNVSPKVQELPTPPARAS